MQFVQVCLVIFFSHRSRNDKIPAGSVKLDVTCESSPYNQQYIIGGKSPINYHKLYHCNNCTTPFLSLSAPLPPPPSHTHTSIDCTRQLESYEKPQPNCFAVGPLVDDGSTRTYYISCRRFGEVGAEYEVVKKCNVQTSIFLYEDTCI